MRQRACCAPLERIIAMWARQRACSAPLATMDLQPALQPINAVGNVWLEHTLQGGRVRAHRAPRVHMEVQTDLHLLYAMEAVDLEHFLQRAAQAAQTAILTSV